MKIILGTAQFGLEYGINNCSGKPTKVEIDKMLKLCLSNGINNLDTAESYGNIENILGELRVIKNGDFLINTKFQISNRKIQSIINLSIGRLNVNYINVLFYHNFSDFRNNPNIGKELIHLKEVGLIKKIGISVYDNSEFEAAIDSQVIDVIQFPFNLLDNQIKRGHLIEMAKECGKELHARSVFLQGLFFKNISDIRGKLTPLIPYLKELSLISNEYGIDINKLAILYAYYHPDIDYIIIGVDNFEQLKSNISILKDKLLPEIKARVDLIEVEQTELLYPKNWN